MEDGGHGRAHTDAIDLILALTSTARISSAAHRRFALVGGDPPDSLRRPLAISPGTVCVADVGGEQTYRRSIFAARRSIPMSKTTA
jgi:hypothetical protein